MSENETNKNVSKDEIDLLDLFRRVGQTFNRWFKALVRAFLTSVVFLLKRWLPLGISIVAAVAVSYFTRTVSPSTYISDMTLRSNLTPSSEMINYINKLHIFSEEGNIPALADALSLELDSDNCYITDIAAFWIIDEHNDGSPDYVDYSNSFNYDSSNVRMDNSLDIRVKFKTSEKLPDIRNGILSYINNNSFFQQRNLVRLRLKRELLSRLNYDIFQLDSLQKIKYYVESKNRQSSNGGQMIFLQEQKTQLIYSDIYNLYSQKQILESELELRSEIVYVVSDFAIRTKRDNGTLYYGKKIIPLFFFLTLIILILHANWVKLKEIYNKY